MLRIRLHSVIRSVKQSFLGFLGTKIPALVTASSANSPIAAMIDCVFWGIEMVRKMSLGVLPVLALLLAQWSEMGVFAWADQNYSKQVFFENSLSPGNYFYSSYIVN